MTATPSRRLRYANPAFQRTFGLSPEQVVGARVDAFIHPDDLATVRREPYALTATYTYVRARETVNGHEQDVPLTPRHGAGVVAMWEAEDAGRVGVEWYYTGRQALDENPYRSTSEPYMIVGVLAEKQFGRIRLFVNGENLTGVRQTGWDPLLRSTRAADGRWTVDAWAPVEGRNINGGLRLAF